MNCEFGTLSDRMPRCHKPATHVWWGHWFCDEHGERDTVRITRKDGVRCITRLPEEPSCPSCERTREIIAAKIKETTSIEVEDALLEILEAIRIL